MSVCVCKSLCVCASQSGPGFEGVSDEEMTWITEETAGRGSSASRCAVPATPPEIVLCSSDTTLSSFSLRFSFSCWPSVPEGRDGTCSCARRSRSSCSRRCTSSSTITRAFALPRPPLPSPLSAKPPALATAPVVGSMGDGLRRIGLSGGYTKL